MGNDSLLKAIDALREGSPARMAMRDSNGRSLTHERLSVRAHNLAKGLLDDGLSEGDHVLFAVRPGIDAAILMIAIASAGGVLIPLDPTMGDELFARRMTLLAPKWVVAESSVLTFSRLGFVRALFAKCGIRVPPIAAIESAKFIRVGRWLPGIPYGVSTSDIEKRGSTADSEPDLALHADRPAMIVFTSGTTDAPKAVVHTWRSMWAVLQTIGSLMAAGEGDVVYACEMHLILPALFAGALVVVPPNSGFSERRLCRDLAEYDVTHFFGVSAELQQLTDYLHDNNQRLPSTVREIWIGAAPVRQSFLRRFETVVDREVAVWCVYGMTEILPVARVSLVDKLEYQGAGDLVGPCVPGVVARVSDDNELFLSGPNLFAAYFGEAPCNELATGDLAAIEDGRVILLGRKKDMIIRGQVNIYPELFESTIEKMPGVARCAMIGIADSRSSDERVLLAVELEDGVDAKTFEPGFWRQLRSGDLCIDGSAIPDEVLITKLPLSGRSSKVDKIALREIANGRLQCE